MNKDPFLRMMEQRSVNLCDDLVRRIVDLFCQQGFVLRSRNRTSGIRVFDHSQMQGVRAVFDPRNHRSGKNRMPCIVIERITPYVAVEIDRVNFFCLDISDPDVIVWDAEDFLASFVSKYTNLLEDRHAAAV